MQSGLLLIIPTSTYASDTPSNDAARASDISNKKNPALFISIEADILSACELSIKGMQCD